MTMATRENWKDAWSVVYEAIPADSHTPCPNCGSDALRIVFTADPHRDVGYAEFWCDNCLEGIGVSRTVIPEGAVVRNIHDAPEDRRPKIPDFTLIS
jgi:hypothetical protein